MLILNPLIPIAEGQLARSIGREKGARDRRSSGYLEKKPRMPFRRFHWEKLGVSYQQGHEFSAVQHPWKHFVRQPKPAKGRSTREQRGHFEEKSVDDIRSQRDDVALKLVR